MKIALFISGKVRTLFFKFHKNLELIRDRYPNCDIDVYYSFWDAIDRTDSINDPWHFKAENYNLDSIDKDRKTFFENIFPKNGGLLVALHNNYKGYNIYQEVENSDAISIKDDQNPRDFFLCTNREDFELLAKSPYNVVLQNNLPAKDDGSLSWAALKNQVRYINIETRLGWLSMQKRMLAYVEKTLP